MNINKYIRTLNVYKYTRYLYLFILLIFSTIWNWSKCWLFSKWFEEQVSRERYCNRGTIDVGPKNKVTSVEHLDWRNYETCQPFLSDGLSVSEASLCHQIRVKSNLLRGFYINKPTDRWDASYRCLNAVSMERVA